MEKVFKKKKLGEYNSKIFVGEEHPLYNTAKKNQKIDIQEILKYEFASFLGAVFSETEEINKSTDGWRDDKFKRKISVKSNNIEAALRLTASGKYLSYLPTRIANERTIIPLQIIGCPYQCITEVFLIAKKNSDYSWLSKLF